MLGDAAHMHEGTQGMHPLVILDPNSNALSGQVALKYVNKLDLQRVGSRSSNSWRWKNGRPRARRLSVGLKGKDNSRTLHAPNHMSRPLITPIAIDSKNWF